MACEGFFFALFSGMRNRGRGIDHPPPGHAAIALIGRKSPDPIRTGELNFWNSMRPIGPLDAIVRCCSSILFILMGQTATELTFRRA